MLNNKIKEYLKYFILLDKKYDFNHFTIEPINSKYQSNFNSEEISRYKFRFNKYIYINEILNILLNNKKVFGTSKFCSFEKGPVHYNTFKELTDKIYLDIVNTITDKDIKLEKKRKRIS